MKQMLEVDVIVSHPKGMTEEMKTKIEDAICLAAEEFGGEVGGSFELVDEPVSEPRELIGKPL